MWTGFIWITIENFRGHHCNKHSDALTPWFERNTKLIFPEIEKCSCSLIELYSIDPSEQYVLSARSIDRYNAETNQRCDVINFVTTRSEILHRIPTVKSASILLLCCVFRNSTVYSATWNVLIYQVMYILIRFKSQTVSVSLSECLALFTAVTFGVSSWAGFMSFSHTLFLWHFRCFNIRVEFNKYLRICVLISHPLPSLSLTINIPTPTRPNPSMPSHSSPSHP
jgi:hypothetical protein